MKIFNLILSNNIKSLHWVFYLNSFWEPLSFESKLNSSKNFESIVASFSNNLKILSHEKQKFYAFSRNIQIYQFLDKSLKKENSWNLQKKEFE